MQQRIEFSRVRDLGELFSASFQFLKVHLKSYFGVLLIIGGPAYLIGLVMQTLYQIKMLQGLGSLEIDSDNPFAYFESMMSWEFFASIVFGIIASIFITVASYGYIKLYMEGNDQPSVAAVWEICTERFATTLLATIAMGIALAIAFVLLVIPGIWLGVSLSVFFAVLILEKEGVSAAFSRSIKLVNGSWWSTFGMIIVVFILFALLSMAITLPFTILGLFYRAGSDGVDGIEKFTIISTIINRVFGFLLYGFLPVITAFLFGSLREKREGSSLNARIENLGVQSGAEKPEEEF